MTNQVPEPSLSFLSLAERGTNVSQLSIRDSNQRWACYSDAMLLAHTIIKKEFWCSVPMSNRINDPITALGNLHHQHYHKS